MIPIFESGDQENVDNYRPVSVLNCLSKVCERIVFNALYSFLAREKLLHKLHSGFRHFHPTATSLIDSMYENMDNGYITGALFLDLSKAFDTVYHSVLANKVSLLNPSEMLLKWSKSYLTERQQVVDFRGTLSRTALLTT